MMRFDWYSFIGGILGGGLLLRLCEFLIAWARERREQRIHESSQEKDRPRSRVDATEIEGTHPNIPTIHIEILSLGGLPLTINDGYITIEPANSPGAIQPQSLRGKAISPSAPIVAEFKVAGKYIYPMGVTERYTIKLICKFSYEDNKPYEDEQHYNRQTHKFEHLH